MANVIMYKSNDTSSQIDEEGDLLCVEAGNPNIEETLFQYKNNESIDKRSNIDITSELLESKFESALIDSKIPYCKPNHLIGAFDGSPSFIIPILND